MVPRLQVQTQQLPKSTKRRNQIPPLTSCEACDKNSYAFQIAWFVFFFFFLQTALQICPQFCQIPTVSPSNPQKFSPDEWQNSWREDEHSHHWNCFFYKLVDMLSCLHNTHLPIPCKPLLTHLPLWSMCESDGFAGCSYSWLSSAARATVSCPRYRQSDWGKHPIFMVYTIIGFYHYRHPGWTSCWLLIPALLAAWKTNFILTFKTRSKTEK